MTSQITGSCQCGSVRYLVSSAAHRLNVCHCRDCQKQSGSAFGLSLIIEPGAFTLKSGELKEFRYQTDSGREKTCAFCPLCGVRIYNATSALVALKAGTLDDTTWLQPVAHYWTKSKQPWVAISNDLPCYAEYE
ncbi:MAG: GFA family protein [Pseudomonadales bacterium]